MLNFLTNDLLMALSVLISGLVALLVTRLVILPRRRRKLAQKKCDEIMQRKAMRRLEEIRFAENTANDPWSQTCSHDTIARELTLAQRRSLEGL